MKRIALHGGIVVLGVTAALGISFFESKGVRTLWLLSKEKVKLDEEIVELKKELSDLQYTIRTFKLDKHYRERIVRQRTGYLAEHELLVEWPE